MRKIVVALAVAGALLPSLSYAQSGVEPFLRSAPSGPPDSGVSMGVRAAYALPFGSFSGAANSDISNQVAGMIPFQVDAGWRFNRQWYAGAYLQYGIDLLSSDQKARCDANNFSCSSSDLRFGLDVVYTILPDGDVLPWVGVGAGYEMLKVSLGQGGGSGDATAKGWEFGHLSAGVDFRLASWFRAGPYLTVSLAQFQSVESNVDPATGNFGANQTYDYPQKALHGWLQLGLKGTFDL